MTAGAAGSGVWSHTRLFDIVMDETVRTNRISIDELIPEHTSFQQYQFSYLSNLIDKNLQVSLDETSLDVMTTLHNTPHSPVPIFGAINAQTMCQTL